MTRKLRQVCLVNCGLSLFFSVSTVLAHGAVKNKSTFHGFIFQKSGNYYISEYPNSTFPEYRIEWKDPASATKICLYNKDPSCHAYTLTFQVREERGKKTTILSSAEVFPSQEMLLRRYEALRTILGD